MGRTLYVVPTAGSCEEGIRGALGGLTPKVTGIQRYLAALTNIRETGRRQNADIIFVGGKRLRHCRSEAVVLRKWAARCKSVREDFPLGDFSLASGTFTAEDMVALAEWFQPRKFNYSEIILVGHPMQTELASITLADRGVAPGTIRFLNSGELRPYSLWLFKILLRIYNKDACWQRPWYKSPLAAILRWKAHRRIWLDV